MSHAHEGTIVALRDGALVDADERIRAEESGGFDDALQAAVHRADWIAATLAEADFDVDTEAAKRAVRERMDGIRAAEKPRRRRIPLGQAAAMVLLGAAAASALPNSPVRTWIEDRGSAMVATPGMTEVAAAAPALTAIEVPVGAGGLLIELRGVPERAEIEVLWTDGATAHISAADGSSFTFAEGRAESVVTGGPVQLRLPTSAGPLRVDVNGRRLLSRRADEVELPEGSLVRTPDRLVIQVPQY